MNKILLDTNAYEVLNTSETTADIFGQLKDTLKRSGTLLPINDIWIAAHAIETGSALITYGGLGSR